MKLFELEATIDLDATGFDEGVTDAEGKGKSLAEKLGADADSIKKAFDNAFSISIGSLMADGFRKALGAAWDFVGGSVEVASSLEEIQNVVTTVFGSNTSTFEKWAQDAIDKFGMGELAAKQYASTIASVLSAPTRGFNAEEVYNMSTSLTQLIGDIASFQNLGFDETFSMIMSGLRGETESIERIGIDMRAGTMARFMGMQESDWGKLSDYEQTMARYNYIMQSTMRMHGDFERTKDSYANQQRLFEENMKELQATIGESLLPVMTSMLEFMNGLFGSTESAEEQMDSIRGTMVDTYAQVDTTATSVLNLISALERMEEQGVDTEEEQGVWNALLEELNATLPDIGTLINTTTGEIEGGTAALREYATQWQKTQREIAVATALQEAQNIISAKAREVAELEMNLSLAKTKAESRESMMDSIFEDVADYFGYTKEDNIDQASLLVRLADAVNQGDSVAGYYYNRIEALDNAEDDISELENRLAAAQMELAELNEEYIVMDNRMRQLVNETGSYMPEPGMMGEEEEAWIPKTVEEELAYLKKISEDWANAEFPEIEDAQQYKAGLNEQDLMKHNLDLAYYAAAYVGTDEAMGYYAIMEDIYRRRADDLAAYEERDPAGVAAATAAAAELAETATETAAAAEELTAAASIIAEKGEATAADDESELPPMNITINLTLDGVVEQTVELTMAEIARQSRTKSQTN